MQLLVMAVLCEVEVAEIDASGTSQNKSIWRYV
jgi:hypothetical protein